MQVQTAQKPLALRSLKRVDIDQPKVSKPVSKWNWTPSISNPEALNTIVASGGNTTTRNTFSSQQDHGENY
jgi:hypothetical protein